VDKKISTKICFAPKNTYDIVQTTKMITFVYSDVNLYHNDVVMMLFDKYFVILPPIMIR